MKLVISLFFIFLISCENVSKNNVVDKIENTKNIIKETTKENVAKLIEPDGSFSQYSLNYHRMMLDTVSFAEIWREKLKLKSFTENFYKQVSSSSLWMFQMISPINGDGPNVGANDGSHLFQLTDSSYRDYRPSVHLAVRLFCKKIAFKAPGQWNNHLLWLGVSEAELNPPKYKNCDYDFGGYKILRYGNSNVFFKYPS